MSCIESRLQLTKILASAVNTQKMKKIEPIVKKEHHKHQKTHAYAQQCE